MTTILYDDLPQKRAMTLKIIDLRCPIKMNLKSKILIQDNLSKANL